MGGDKARRPKTMALECAEMAEPPQDAAQRRGRTAENLGEAAAGLVVAALAGAARLRPFRNPDVLWQVRTGDLVLATWRPVPVDRFTSTLRGQPIHDHEPAFEALVAWVDRAAGLDALWWINLALAALACVAAFRYAARLVPSPTARLVAVALIVVGVAPRLELRAEAASFLAIAVAHALRRADGDDARPRWTRRLAPIACAAIGSPFHGLALLTALVPATHAGETLLRGPRRPGAWRSIAIDVCAAIGCVFAAELVMPGMIANVLGNAGAEAFKRHIIEGYSPLRFFARTGDPQPIVALAIALVAAAGLLTLRRPRGDGGGPRARLADVLLIVLMVPPGVKWTRFAAVAVLAALPWAIGGVAAVADLALRRTRPRPLVSVGVALIAAATCAYRVTESLGSDGRVVGFDWSTQPIATVEWLRAHRPDAALFNTYNYGPYLIYARYPPRGVTIDTRSATVYPGPYAERYYAALADPAVFEAWVAEAGFDTVLIQRAHVGSAPLRLHLSASPRWASVAYDRVSLVFVRR